MSVTKHLDVDSQDKIFKRTIGGRMEMGLRADFQLFL